MIITIRMYRLGSDVARTALRFLLCLPLFWACDKEDLAAERPAFVQIGAFCLETDGPREGSASQKITEAWLSLDGQFLGAYSLPARVPVLGSGQHIISLRPGIRDNGISTSPAVYPFYRDVERTLDLQPGAEFSIDPCTAYDARARFAFIEDFESGRPVFGEVLTGSSANALRPVGEDAFEGTYSGRIHLTRDDPVVEIATLDRYRELDNGGSFLYLEINFKSEVPVLFGLMGYDDSAPERGIALYDPGFLPSDNWNKIYFNFTPLLLQADADAYRVVLQATLPQEEGVYTMDEASIWLDNLKLVHF